MSPVLLDFRENAALTFLTRLTPLPTAILKLTDRRLFGVLSKYAVQYCTGINGFHCREVFCFLVVVYCAVSVSMKLHACKHHDEICLVEKRDVLQSMGIWNV
uniref:Uncharacterized protein n=1 Tax=Salix viminalis TaxID=40686 RepID=A0A6N2KJ85_SALVM